jgi:hypothetical protein
MADYICGSLKDIMRLSMILKAEIENTNDKELPKVRSIKDSFLINNDYIIEMRIMEYGYDPASTDTQLWATE